jgi:hypothetical protein
MCMHAGQGSKHIQVPSEQGAELRQGAPCRVLYIRRTGDLGVKCRQDEGLCSKCTDAAHQKDQLVPAASRTSVHGDDEVEGGRIRQTLAGLQRIVQCDVGLCSCVVNPAPQTNVPCQFNLPTFWSSRYTRLFLKPAHSKQPFCTNIVFLHIVHVGTEQVCSVPVLCCRQRLG